MVLILIDVALNAVYILLRISGKRKSPIIPMPPNPTLERRRMKITRSIKGSLMESHLSRIVHMRWFLHSTVLRGQLIYQA